MKTAFFLGQTGGSGNGDFALIKIEYPQGQQVAVTFNGSTEEAPDTSGVWMYGCDEIGTYIVSIVGTSIQQQVQITTKGQIETIWISQQVVNYTLIYHLGEEFATTIPSQYTGGSATLTGGWTVGTKTQPSYYNKYIPITSNIPIDASNYTKGFFFRKITLAGVQYWYVSSVYTSLVNSSDASENISYVAISGLELNKVRGVISGATFGNLVTQLQSGVTWNQDIETQRGAPECNIIKQASYIQAYAFGGSDTVNNRLVNRQIYAIGFCNEDDISGLSNYGSDIATILSNASSLFQDDNAIDYMIAVCTGDFMISALSNDNFINVMNDSTYATQKTKLMANEHWGRFIALLSL